MKQHAQENAPASVQHFYPPLLPVTLSSSTFRSIFVPASSFCRLIDASVHLVYKREDRIGDDFIADIFFYLYHYVIHFQILNLSLRARGSFRSFRLEISTIRRSISNIFTIYESIPNTYPWSKHRNLSTIIGRSIINYLRLGSTNATPLIIRPTGRNE